MQILGTQVTVFEAGSSELEALVYDQYNAHQYEFQASEECSSDQASVYSVSKNEGLFKWDEEKLNRFKAGNFEYRITRTLLQDLVNRDVIPVGQYNVEC